MQRREIAMMLLERQPNGSAKVSARVEIKTGGPDTTPARGGINSAAERGAP
jgi:hypothetical protein